MVGLQNLKKEIAKSVKAEVREVYKELNKEFDDVIESATEFSDIGFKKNIVLSGELLNSKEQSIKETETKVEGEWEWDPINPETNSGYAIFVKLGFHAFGGPTFVPGRDWEERATENIDPPKALVKKLKRKGYDARVTRQLQF